MYKITRVTSEYIETEDRIRLVGLADDGETHVLWFTLRLTNRLIAHCLSILTKFSPEISKSAVDERTRSNVQNLIQESATRQIVEEPPVKIKKGSYNCLVKEIDVSYTSEGLLMTFRATDQNSYELYLGFQQLRQWLSMLYLIWQKAEWPAGIWPDWIVKKDSVQDTKESPLH